MTEKSDITAKWKNDIFGVSGYDTIIVIIANIFAKIAKLALMTKTFWNV